MMNQFTQNPMMQNQMYYPQAQKQTNGITWVQGLEGAKAFQLQPNSNAIMLDSEIDNRFYIKTSDNIGMCNLRIFEYKEVTDNQTKIDLSNLVTKDELQAAIKEIKNEQSLSRNALIPIDQ